MVLHDLHMPPLHVEIELAYTVNAIDHWTYISAHRFPTGLTCPCGLCIRTSFSSMPANGYQATGAVLIRRLPTSQLLIQGRRSNTGRSATNWDLPRTATE